MQFRKRQELESLREKVKNASSGDNDLTQKLKKTEEEVI